MARKIRENPLFEDVMLVALTGYGMDADVQAAKAADARLIGEILGGRPRQQKAS